MNHDRPIVAGESSFENPDVHNAVNSAEKAKARKS